MTKIIILQDDLTTMHVDAIVNPANRSLLGGGGLDGAIHRAAGPELRNECIELFGCKTGEAKITMGYNLPAKHVIHTVGPMYGYEDGHEVELLQAAYRNSLVCAQVHGIRNIAFPSISTGGFCFPKDEAAKIATEMVRSFVELNPEAFDEITFVLFNDLDRYIFESIFNGKTSFTIEELHAWWIAKNGSKQDNEIQEQHRLMRACYKVLRGSEIKNDLFEVESHCGNFESCPEEYLKYFKNSQAYHAFNMIREEWGSNCEYFDLLEIGWLENKMSKLKFIPERKISFVEP